MAGLARSLRKVWQGQQGVVASTRSQKGLAVSARSRGVSKFLQKGSVGTARSLSKVWWCQEGLCKSYSQQGPVGLENSIRKVQQGQKGLSARCGRVREVSARVDRVNKIIKGSVNKVSARFGRVGRVYLNRIFH